jgi:hypothetical protein
MESAAVPVPASTICGSVKILRLVTPGVTADSYQCVQSLKPNEPSRAEHWQGRSWKQSGDPLKRNFRRKTLACAY